MSTADIAPAPFLSGVDTVVFVHGWNMTDGTQLNNAGNSDWKKASAETAFKRLYWQGFRGNYVAFDWPTFSDAEGPLAGSFDFLNLTYNASEYQAWRSGQALMDYLASIKSPEGSTYLLAHSMGNVVAAEALRQWTASGHEDPIVTTYVAMQAAISAGAYGSNDQAAGAGDSETDLYRHWPYGVGSETTADYYMAWSEDAASKWVNMYNPLDAATDFAWGLNNGAKGGLLQGTVWNWRYAWYPNRGGYLRGYYDQLVGTSESHWVSEATLTAGLRLPDDLPGPGPSAYEAMAFLAQSKSKPVGTMNMEQQGDGRFSANYDVRALGLPAPYIDKWIGHSFQFYFDAVTTTSFWGTIRTETGFRSTLD